MDKQSRIGIGASAMIAVILYFAPLLGWLYAGPAIFVCAVVAVWGLWPIARATWKFVAKHQKWISNGAVACGLLLLGAGFGGLIGNGNYAFWALSPNLGPIAWNFEETAKGRGYFLDWQKREDEEINVVGFGAIGKNNSPDPIDDFQGYLRSDVTNERLPLYILAANAIAAHACTFVVPTLPDDTKGIPAFSLVQIVTRKKPFFMNVTYPETLPFSKFESEFVPFTIVMHYAGKEYKRQFSRDEVERQKAVIEKQSGPPTEPYVVQKDTVPEVPVKMPPLTPLIRPSPSINPDATSTVPQR